MAKSVIIHHYGKVNEDCFLSFYNHELYNQSLIQLKGKEFDLIIKERKKNVSLDTHAYYRGGVIAECLKYEKFNGWTKEDVHDFFASIFLSSTKQLRNGENDRVAFIPTIKSTSDLSQSEMNEYINKVVKWLSEKGIVIHPPEQYYNGIFKSHEK